MAAKVTQQQLVGVPAAAWPWVVAGLKRPAVSVVVAPDASGVEALAAGLRVTVRDEILVFPGLDVQPYDRVGASGDILTARGEVLGRLRDGFGGVVVTSMAALGVRVFESGGAAIEVEAGGIIKVSELVKELVELGYKREEVVQEVGGFAVRGGIVDVWGGGMAAPVRMELFDDEVERIREFDAVSQKTTGENIPLLRLGAAGSVVLDEEAMGCFRRRYRELFPDGMDDEVYAAVSEGVMVPEAGAFLPLFSEEELPSLWDVVPANALVVVPDMLEIQAEGWDELVQGAYAARREGSRKAGGVRALPPELMFVPAAKLLGEVRARAQVVLGAFDDGKGTNAGVRAHMFGQSNRHAAALAAAKDVGLRVKEGWRVVLTAPSEAGLAQFIRAMESEGAPMARLVEGLRLDGLPKEGCFWAGVSGIAAGWVEAKAKVMVLAESDVFGARIGRAAKKKSRSPEEMMAMFSEMREDDYVVHEAHGIGRFGGISTMDVGGVRQDFIKLFYAGEDRLFVPVENLDVLSRYKGAEAGNVVLDRLGTGGWEVRKAKVKEDLLAMADDLLATAAARELVSRTPIEKVAGLYDEFCAGFPYPLTEDQERVMAEVEEDLAAGVPMDRLVVGDVGFGKTEVALRAAFLMASAGKQVAVVCPTTLLARQHFAVFAERMAGFPLKVGRLSRMVGTVETKQTKQGLADGTVQVVVGTHALLSKDLKFADLGLVVIDEEQRFGVAHKERLKGMREEVDVLTLTATPIPRTLQMAVGGVRQLSLITTPPVDRQAVQTFVLPWDNVTLKGAMTRELVRGGQVYVVAPHVEDLPKLQDELAVLVPEARVGIAHGQMAEGQLEAVMEGFYEGSLDVLLATTIIESGLDVPRANTLIVYRADRFGLAQLYQLRGRVGRSTMQAFAYFILPDGHVGAEAAKRLTILQRLDGLGAGFMLASYDMDLRGFGNLLGKQQSGNIRDIGFELYAKMLKEAVESRQRRKAAQAGVKKEVSAELKASSVTMKLGVSYLIPEGYVADVGVRLQLYRRLAGITTEEGIVEFKEELVDRFGALPVEVEALLGVVSLRNRAVALNVSKIEVGEKGIVVGFEKGRFANPVGLIGLIQKLAGVVSVRPDQSLVWYRRLGVDVLGGVGRILSELEGVVLV